jgi:hypothetical protein
VLASTFVPLLVRRLLSRIRPRAGSVGVRARGCSAAGRRSCRSSFPSWGCSYTRTICGAGNGAGCWSWGSGSCPSS